MKQSSRWCRLVEVSYEALARDGEPGAEDGLGPETHILIASCAEAACRKSARISYEFPPYVPHEFGGAGDRLCFFHAMVANGHPEWLFLFVEEPKPEGEDARLYKPPHKGMH
jgi:hypothetical protein